MSSQDIMDYDTIPYNPPARIALVTVKTLFSAVMQFFLVVTALDFCYNGMVLVCYACSLP